MGNMKSTFTMLIQFAVFTAISNSEPTLASSLFDTSREFYQNELQSDEKLPKMCRALPNLNNLIWPEGLLYASRGKVVEEHLSPELRVDYPVNSRHNLIWPPIQVFKNYKAHARIDFVETVHGSEVTEEDEEWDQIKTNEITGGKYYTTTYYMKYLQDWQKDRSAETLYYGQDMSKVYYQTILNYGKLRESIYNTDALDQEGNQSGIPSCSEFLYFQKAYEGSQKDIGTILSIIWRPEHPEHGVVTQYVGEVCIDSTLPMSAHAFVGADVEGNQFTAFFDVVTLRPFLVKYNSMHLMIRPEDWIPRGSSSFNDEEFKLHECTHPETGEDLGAKVSNYPYETPMLFLAHFGFLSS